MKCFAVLLVGSLVGVSLAAPPVIPEAVKTSVRNRVDFGYVPGMVIVMVNADGPSYFSYGNLSYDKPWSTDETARYEIASVTKTFTALLLSEMVEAGDVSLNDTVASFLPDGVDIPTGGETMTLKHLATHTSGLPSIPPNLIATITDHGNQFANYFQSDFYEFLNTYTLPRVPGASYEYSNAGIGLLGHVLALSQGRDFETLLKERVLDPMGMIDTKLTLSESDEALRAPGHHGVLERPKFEMNVLAPAGGLFSSTEDLGTYLSYQLGVPGGDLGPAVQATHEKYFDLPGMPYDMGLGWWRWRTRNVVQHGGDSFGSTSFVGFKDSTQTGVAILSNNRGHNTLSVSDLGFHCLDQTEPLNEILALPSVGEEALRNLVGKYQHASGAVFDVGLKSGWLFLDIVGQSSYTLFHINGGTQFKMLDFGLDADVTFPAERMTYRQNSGTLLSFDRVRRDGRLVLAREDTNVVLHLEGEGDESYPVEWSSDLQTWHVLGARTIWDAPYEEALGGAKYFRIGE